jgi:hypothetical protein
MDHKRCQRKSSQCSARNCCIVKCARQVASAPSQFGIKLAPNCGCRWPFQCCWWPRAATSSVCRHGLLDQQQRCFSFIKCTFHQRLHSSFREHSIHGKVSFVQCKICELSKSKFKSWSQNWKKLSWQCIFVLLAIQRSSAEKPSSFQDCL